MGSERQAGLDLSGKIDWHRTADIPADWNGAGHDYVVWLNHRVRAAQWLPESSAWLVGSHLLHRSHPSHFARVDPPE